MAGRSNLGRWPRIWAGRKLGWKFGWLEAGFLALVLVALVLRLWELGGRTMHYDEAIHLHYAWKLSNLEEYIHSPWMHGPFQIELTAVVLRILGDTDFTARLAYAVFGTALVSLPYFLRHYLGRVGALLAAVMLTLSPSLLYFSRFGRNDILIAFWATALLVVMWRYVHEDKDRYLYIAAAILAFMFATKETAYFVVLIFGLMMFPLALPQLVPWVMGRAKMSELRGPAGFLLILVTLTLPQWSAAVGLFQDLLGVVLINADPLTGNNVANIDGSDGLTGGPAWAGRMVVLPLLAGAWWLPLIGLPLLLGGIFRITGRLTFSRVVLVQRLGIPLLAVTVVYLAAFRPVSFSLLSDPNLVTVDFVLAGVVAVVTAGLLIYYRVSWRRIALVVLAPVALTLMYTALFTPLVSVDSVVNGVLPTGIQVDASTNAIPLNFVVAAGILGGLFLVSIMLGVSWRGGVWLICAGIFYLVWLALYTTLFTNWAGFFSGVWQGLGYWIVQQDVARGNQPWYYYFVGITVYELLPVLFGSIGAIYYLRRGDVFGLALAFWAGATFLLYVLATEKMPWLLVNITFPFILLSGKYLGELACRVRWRPVWSQGQFLLAVVVLWVSVSAVYLLRRVVDVDSSFAVTQWGLLAALILVTLLGAYLVRTAQPKAGAAMVGLATAALLLGLGTWGAFRASYTFDDSYKEFLVYAQGSADLERTFQALDREVFASSEHTGAVAVDYDLWYPFQWYVRDQQRDGELTFACFKDEDEEGWDSSCNPIVDVPTAQALLLDVRRTNVDEDALNEYRKEGPFKDLLWFPESYRRPGENRDSETMGEQLALDFQFFQASLVSKDAWSTAIDYILFRTSEQEWYTSEYYSYLP